MVRTRHDVLMQLLTRDCKITLRAIDDVLVDYSIDLGLDEITIEISEYLSVVERELVKKVLEQAGWKKVDIDVNRVILHF